MEEVYYKRSSSNKLPSIRVFASENASKNLVRFVQRIVQTIDLGDTELFPEPHRHFFAMIKRDGAERAYLAVQDIQAASNIELQLRKRDVLHRLGQVIFDRLPRKIPKRPYSFFPYHDVNVSPCDVEWHVRIRALRSAHFTNQTIYYSAHEPTIEVNGQKKTVAFTQHAIEQTCDRIIPTWRSYWGLADVYAFFADCVHFEPAKLYPCSENPDGLGFTFYNTCALDSFHAGFLNIPNQYAFEVIGLNAIKDSLANGGTDWFYRIGYASAVVLGDFIVAKTVLYPGHRTTPEYSAILKSGVSEREQTEMVQKATNPWQIDELLQSMDFSMIKWFHDQGIPQVIRLPRGIFALNIDE